MTLILVYLMTATPTLPVTMCRSHAKHESLSHLFSQMSANMLQYLEVRNAKYAFVQFICLLVRYRIKQISKSKLKYTTYSTPYLHYYCFLCESCSSAIIAIIIEMNMHQFQRMANKYRDESSSRY